MSCSICYIEKDDTYRYCCSDLCNDCFLKIKGICPICDRENLNKQVNCERCNTIHKILDINNCDMCNRNICNDCNYFSNKYTMFCKKRCLFKFINELYNDTSDLFTLRIKNF